LTKQIPNTENKLSKNHRISRQALILWSFLLLLGVAQNTQAQFAAEYQTPDSTFLGTHSPHKATFLSALVPGLGQIYNQKYWKVPIIYAGFGGLLYYANYNNYVYQKYKDAYNIKIRIKDGETGLVDPFPRYQEANIQRQKEVWRRYRDLMYISIGILYVIQILDADVDAHLFDFDMSEDLSLHVEPAIAPVMPVVPGATPTTSLGVNFAIRF
jgi:hypothetical protein